MQFYSAIYVTSSVKERLSHISLVQNQGFQTHFVAMPQIGI